MNEKLTKLEKQWIMYDVGNSAFILLATTIIPVVFKQLTEAGGLSSKSYFAYWSYATTISTLVVGVLGPILGAASDFKGGRKKFFSISLFVGLIGCILMPFLSTWLLFLVTYIIAKIGFSTSLIFYDSMLTDVTTPERMDEVSSYGFAWGYIGSIVPFIISIGLIFFGGKIGLSTKWAVIGAFVITGIWWLIFSLPLYKNYEQKYYIEKEGNRIKVGQVFRQLGETFKDIKKDKKVLLFLVAFFFYIDGVYTIINMATAYGESLGLDSKGLILALLVTQIVAFPFAIGFSKLSKKYRTDVLIKICIVAYTLIALYGIQLDKLYEFWILAIAVGMFQGAIQALSRSYFAKIIPAEKSGEYFGIYDICGKGASIIGALLVGVITQVFDNQQIAVGSLAIMFVVGLIIFSYSNKKYVK